MRSPITVGALLALGAAIAFGSTIPFVHRYGAHVGAFTTASALYVGAAVVAFSLRMKADAEAPVRRTHLARIVLVAIAGAAVAPTALAWGLRHTDATSASLFLNFEALFTIACARIFFHEAIGARVFVAALLVLAGGTLLVVANGRAHADAALGLAAIVVATLGWAVDNTLMRPLASLDPNGVISRKASFGAFFTGVLAIVAREPMPSVTSLGVLLVCGATGYGLSLRLYLLAQRRIGAARTGSVFAVAPFAGAALAWSLGEGTANALTWIAGALFGVAVYLHLSEKHAHHHHHDAITHEHAHRHDDSHHDHTHDPPVAGSHSHPHSHGAMTHDHEHAPDDHHGHRH